MSAVQPCYECGQVERERFQVMHILLYSYAMASLPHISAYALSLLAIAHSHHVGIPVGVLVAVVWTVAAIGTVLIRGRGSGGGGVSGSLLQSIILGVAFLIESICTIFMARYYNVIV